MDGYLSITLTPESQQLLVKIFPPVHPKVFAHHVTIAFKPSVEVYDAWKQYIGQTINLTVYGYAKDEKGEAVMVDGDILNGKKHHITLSTNQVAPIYSITLLQKGYQELEMPFALQGIFEWIEHKPRIN